MVVGITLFIISILVIAVYILFEIRRLRHKLFAIFLIALILFSYLSFTLVLRGHDVDLKTVPGLIKAGELYFLWLEGVAGNFVVLTGNAIQMDWSGVDTQNTKDNNKSIFSSLFNGG